MSNIQTGAERMPHDLSHLGFLAGQIGRLITISTTRSEERFSRNAETDLVCRLLLEKKKITATHGVRLRHEETARRYASVAVVLHPYPTAAITFFLYSSCDLRDLHSFPTRRSSDLPLT